MSKNKIKARMEYFAACVSEFAHAFKISTQSAFAYLDKYKGIDFLCKCYEAEHLVSFHDAVADLSAVCRRNGGCY